MKKKPTKPPQGFIERPAYKVRDLVGNPFGRTRLYEDMKSKRLKAKKNGNSTIILHPDYMEYLRSLPDYAPEAIAETISPSGPDEAA